MATVGSGDFTYEVLDNWAKTPDGWGNRTGGTGLRLAGSGVRVQIAATTR